MSITTRRVAANGFDFAVDEAGGVHARQRIEDADDIGACRIGNFNVALRPADLRDHRMALFDHSAASFEP